MKTYEEVIKSSFFGVVLICGNLVCCIAKQDDSIHFLIILGNFIIHSHSKFVGMGKPWFHEYKKNDSHEQWWFNSSSIHDHLFLAYCYRHIMRIQHWYASRYTRVVIFCAFQHVIPETRLRSSFNTFTV